MLRAVDFRKPAQHYATAARPSAVATGAIEVFFNRGSLDNAEASTTGATLSGLVSGQVERDSICVVTLAPDGNGA